MRNTDCYAESRLPVTLELVTAEVKIPVGYAVKLRQHCFASELMNRGLALLCCCKTDIITQHVYSGNAECAV